MDKLYPHAPKVYSNNWYCQEVLIGVTGAVEKCTWGKEQRGGFLSLDIRKAFNSLSHSYLKAFVAFIILVQEYQDCLSC
jgi:hypothetical protein